MGDQMHGRDRVLHRRADHPGQVVLADQRAASTVTRRVEVQDRPPAIELGEDRFVVRFHQGPPQDSGVHGHPHHVQLVQSPPHLR
jgi:hypothetical protein